MTKQTLLEETICLLSADLYKNLYNPENECGYAETASQIIRYAKQFEKELNWQGEDDERDYIFELEKFEKSLGIKEKPEKVWVFTAEQAWDDETADTIVQTFKTEDAAQKYMKQFICEDGEEPIVKYVKRRGWELEDYSPSHYFAYLDGYYEGNHIECTITECVVK